MIETGPRGFTVTRKDGGKTEVVLSARYAVVPTSVAGLEYQLDNKSLLGIIPSEGEPLLERGQQRVLIHKSKKRLWPRHHWPRCAICRRQIKDHKVAIGSLLNLLDADANRWVLSITDIWHVRCWMTHAVLAISDGQPPDSLLTQKDIVGLGWVNLDLKDLPSTIPIVQALGQKPNP